MTTLDHESVSRFWSTADASILGPYMMDDFGFPAGAGRFVLCRKSTVRQGTTTRQRNHQAAYRSIADNERMFTECKLSVRTVNINTPYVLLQVGCELVTKWQALMRAALQCLPVAGRIAYPELINHFFVLQPDAQPISSSATLSHATAADDIA